MPHNVIKEKNLVRKHLNMDESNNCELPVFPDNKLQEYSIYLSKSTQGLKNKKNRISPSTSKRLPSVSVITCTNRINYMSKVFENYDRQEYDKKELIIVLNNNNMNLEEWIAKSKSYKNIKIFKLDEKITLGECLNFAVKHTSHEIVAKFDDDDYYSSKYLENSLIYFIRTDAGIIGKKTAYLYFEDSKILCIRLPGNENRFVNFVHDSSLLIKREIFNEISFPTITIDIGPDFLFQMECQKRGIKIYSTDRFDYLIKRRKLANEHTWKIDEKELLKQCRIIGKNSNYLYLISNKP